MYVFLVSVFNSFHLLFYKFITIYFLNFFCPLLPSFLSLLSIFSLPYFHVLVFFALNFYFFFDIYIYFSPCGGTYCTCVNIRIIHAPVVFMYSLRTVECNR
jgi:hypothetical protein